MPTETAEEEVRVGKLTMSKKGAVDRAYVNFGRRTIRVQKEQAAEEIQGA